MTDGDVSHSSERRLDTCTKGAGLDLFSLRFAFFFFVFTCSEFAFIQMFISLPVGPHPPNGQNPPLIIFACVFLLYFFVFKMLSYCFILRACILST
jgi:hypothetical protein